MKYLGIRIDKLHWKAHIDNTALKLIRTNTMLYKVRGFVNAGIFHALFESHIHYACIIWEQNVCTINHLFIIHKKALILSHFKECNTHTALLFLNQKL